jgi:hypothetical protein
MAAAKKKVVLADYDEGAVVLVVPGAAPLIELSLWSRERNEFEPPTSPILPERWREVQMPFIIVWKRGSTVGGYLYPPAAVDEINGGCALRICADLKSETKVLGMASVRE